MIDTNWSEHYIKRGDPSKPTYYIIRRQALSEGLFFRFNLIAGHIKYALKKDWIPVVDMQNYPNPYLLPDKLGKENSWEYYFEQPLHVGLEDALNGENVILSDGGIIETRPNSGMAFFENRNGILTEWKTLVKTGLLKIKPKRLEEISLVREKIFSPTDRVLGVLLRGTDYVAEKPKWHPIPPPVEFAASISKIKLREWKCNKIFLATEDKTIIQNFKTFFGEICVTYDREYVDFVPGKRITRMHINRENDPFIQGKDYLTQMVLLSMCNSFIAARCNGSVGVMMFEDHFEHTYFFNLGRYGVLSLD